MKKGKKIRLSKIFLYLLIYGTALLWLFPVVWMIVSSFKPYGTPVSILQEVFPESLQWKIPYHSGKSC